MGKVTPWLWFDTEAEEAALAAMARGGEPRVTHEDFTEALARTGVSPAAAGKASAWI